MRGWFRLGCSAISSSVGRFLIFFAFFCLFLSLSAVLPSSSAHFFRASAAALRLDAHPHPGKLALPAEPHLPRSMERHLLMCRINVTGGMCLACVPAACPDECSLRHLFFVLYSTCPLFFFHSCIRSVLCHARVLRLEDIQDKIEDAIKLPCTRAK